MTHGNAVRRFMAVMLAVILTVGVIRVVVAPSRPRTTVAVTEPHTAPTLGTLDTTSSMPSTSSVSVTAAPTSTIRRPPLTLAPVTAPSTLPRTTVPLTTLPSPAIPTITQPGIYIIRLDGTGLRRISTSGTSPSWAPNGQELGFIAFSSNPITVATLSGVLRPLPSSNDHNFGAPVWSPDSTQVGYTGPSPNSQESDPWIVAADGLSQPHELALAGDNGALTWNVNNRIASTGTTGIETFNPDGSNPQVIYNQGFSGSLRWSPDGRTLVGSGGGYQMLLNADGSNLRYLGGESPPPAPIDGYWDEAHWAPDSRQLVYYETPRRTGHSLIWIAPDDGSPGHVIAQDMEWPDWSPTSNVITTAGGVDANGWFHDLDVMDSTGANVRTLLHCYLATGTLRYPLFSPGGQMIAFEAG